MAGIGVSCPTQKVMASFHDDNMDLISYKIARHIGDQAGIIKEFIRFHLLYFIFIS